MQDLPLRYQRSDLHDSDHPISHIGHTTWPPRHSVANVREVYRHAEDFQYPHHPPRGKNHLPDFLHLKNDSRYEWVLVPLHHRRVPNRSDRGDQPVHSCGTSFAFDQLHVRLLVHGHVRLLCHQKTEDLRYHFLQSQNLEEQTPSSISLFNIELDTPIQYTRDATCDPPLYWLALTQNRYLSCIR